MPVATNHQGKIEQARHAWATATLERESAVQAIMTNSDETAEDLLAGFRRPPVLTRLTTEVLVRSMRRFINRTRQASIIYGQITTGITSEIGYYAQEFINFGGNISDIDIDNAQLHRVRIHEAYSEMFRRNRASILITPTLVCEAFSHGQTHPTEIGSTPITYPWLD